MITNLTVKDLVEYEDYIASLFNNKLIKAPIHLQDGQEQQLIEVFNEVKEDDWIFMSWRSHGQNLLKGRNKDELTKEILAGHSISLCNKEHKIFSSAIVAGNLAIALGLSIDIKRKNQNNKVWCWLGEQTSFNGLFSECINYAINWDLPITYIIENNSRSVKTESYKILNTNRLPFEPVETIGKTIEERLQDKTVYKISPYLYYYYYKMEKWEHAGTKVRVQF